MAQTPPVLTPDASQSVDLPLLAARGLVKRFGAVTALAGVDLDLGVGELVGLLGPNGAGKSTLLRILGTNLIPDGGEVDVEGRDIIKHAQAARTLVGLVLGEERSFYWRLTGRQNLEFFGALQGLRRTAATARAQHLLAQFDLASAADRPVSGYSSGMRARLSLCRGLLATPRVLLLDEPSKSLDPIAARSFRDTIQGLVAEQGIAALFATHDLHEAAALAGRIVVLVGGEIVQVVQRGAGPDELERILLHAVGS